MTMATAAAAHRVPLILFISGLIIAQQLFAVPGNDALHQALQNALHLPWFFAVTCALRYLLGSWRTTLPAALLLALGTEFIQWFTSRDASFTDALRNGAGILTAWSAWEYIRDPKRRLLPVLAAICVTTCSAQLAAAAMDNRHMARAFPVLLDGADPRSRRSARSTAPTEQDAAGLRLIVDGSVWPGIHFDQGVQVRSRWREYDMLHLEITVSAGTTLDLFVGLLLVPGEGITNFAITPLQPGHQRVRVPLDRIRPDRSTLVHDLFLYTSSEYEGRSITVHRAWLD